MNHDVSPPTGIIEECLNKVEDQYEMGFINSDMYEIVGNKVNEAKVKKPFAWKSKLTIADIKVFLCD